MDPSQMTDEELDKAISGEEPEETVNNEEAQVASPEEETPEQPAEPEAEEAGQAAEEEPEEAPAPSRREQLRVQQLLAKYGPPKQQAPQQPEAEALDYREAIDADDNVYQTLESDRQAYGQHQRAQGQNEALKQVQTVKWETLLHIDAPQMESKYAVLNPADKENFHPALADALSQRYLNMVGYDPATGLVANPGIRWKDFVESEFELAEEIANTKVATTAKNIARQAANTGLRPDGSSAKRLNLNQAPEHMTDEELDAVIAQAIPKK